MEIGDRVRLKQPFTPTLISTQTYQFGIIAAIVSNNSQTEVLLYLYNPDTATTYTDEFGERPTYSFRLDEIEPCKDT
ncbi:MAG: hypothetical protein HC769_15120 [Cyanobacteria bacterium CRU_2_1]|nr:hypothetical protein [Cyanobacteria bacterium CRU_2_1]